MRCLPVKSQQCHNMLKVQIQAKTRLRCHVTDYLRSWQCWLVMMVACTWATVLPEMECMYVQHLAGLVLTRSSIF